MLGIGFVCWVNYVGPCVCLFLCMSNVGHWVLSVCWLVELCWEMGVIFIKSTAE